MKDKLHPEWAMFVHGTGNPKIFRSILSGVVIKQNGVQINVPKTPYSFFVTIHEHAELSASDKAAIKDYIASNLKSSKPSSAPSKSEDKS